MAYSESKCQKCGSSRMANVYGKCSDMSNFEIPSLNIEHQGYVVEDAGIGGGDDIDIGYCMDCGQLEGKWPLAKTQLELDALDQTNEGQDYPEDGDDHDVLPPLGRSW